MKLKYLGASVLLIPTLLLSGCSAATGSIPDMSSVAGAPMDSRSSADFAAEATFSEVKSEQSAVIVTGQISLVAKDLKTASTKLSELVGKRGGRIESRSEQPPTDYSTGYSSFTVRIANDKLDEFIESAKELGAVQSISINEQDVSLEYTDLNTRVAALEAGVARLTQLLATADTTDALITIENAITDRQMQLDSLKGQLNSLENQVAESTLTVQLNSETTAETLPPEDFLGGIAQGWEALGAFVVGISIVLGVLIPWLLPLALVGALVWFILRRVRAKKAVAPAAQPVESAESDLTDKA